MVSKQYPDAPRIAVGAVVRNHNKVLLVLRNQAPSKDMWAIPGGSVELGETLQAAAEREVYEETGLKIKAGEVIYIFDSIHLDATGRVEYHYVILDLAAELLEPNQHLVPADDVRAAAWFCFSDLDRLEQPVAAPTQTLLQKILIDQN